MDLDRQDIRRQLLEGRTPEQIAHRDYAAHRAALEEQADLEGELGSFDPTPDTVVYLRDTRRLRWEAISARVFGNARQPGPTRQLYDQAKGPGASNRSYTGRGRRFDSMTDAPPLEERRDLVSEVAPPNHATTSGTASPERLREVDILRVGSTAEVRQYLESHLHSDRLYLDSGRIWLELPNTFERPPDVTIMNSFLPLSSYIVASQASVRVETHVVPAGSSTTLCQTDTDPESDMIVVDNEPSCRCCQVALLASEIATGRLPKREITPAPGTRLATGTQKPKSANTFRNMQTLRATIGPNDPDLFASPVPKLLYAISGIEPVAKGTDVRLDQYGVQSTQRLGAGDVGGNLWIALWPAELKEQANYLYGNRLARPMIAAARKQGWTATANAHLAFRNSQPSLRLYMAPAIDASEYAGRWEDGDLERVGAHSREDVRRTLWPWLKSRGYVEDADDRVLEEWLSSCLGNRPAFMRPGLFLKRKFSSTTAAEVIRREVNAILAAAHEPALPATRPADS